MSVGLAALASAGGGLLQTYGNWKSNLAAIKGMERESLVKESTAQEIRYRSEINQMAIKKTGQIIKGEQITQIAGSGRGISASFAILEQTARDIANEVVNEKRQSEYAANVAEAEAINLRQQAKQGRKAAVLGLFGGLLSAGGKTASATPGGKRG